MLLIDPSGQSLGSFTLQAAEKVAEEQYGLDLVEVRPGVYKILNIGKLQYEASKRKVVKGKQIKEMKFKLNIGDSDFATKTGHIKRFLNEGNSVKVTIWFSGREVSRPEHGVSLMERIAASVSEIGNATINKTMQGRNMTMGIAPVSRKTEPM